MRWCVATGGAIYHEMGQELGSGLMQLDAGQANEDQCYAKCNR